jgi:homoserine kinase type II
MADHSPIDPVQLTASLGRYGLPAPTEVKPEPRGGIDFGYHVWTGGHRFFMRLLENKKESDVRFAAEVLQYLHAARFPVGELKLTQDHKPWVDLGGGRLLMLYVYASGEPLPHSEINPERCHRLGEELGRLHELAAGFAHARPNPYGRAWVKDRLHDLTSAPPADEEVKAALPVLNDELAVAHKLPGAPRGLIHCALFPHNVLWIGDRVSIVLDWELSGIDPFAYDLGVALLGWCWTDGFDAHRARGLLAGYGAERKIEHETKTALYEWTRFAALRYTVSLLRGYSLPGVQAAAPSRHTWREFRDRLTALRGMSEIAFRKLVAV